MITTLSIIIPSYRRGEILLETLSALSLMSAEGDEILVVDQTEPVSNEVAGTLAERNRVGAIRWIRHQPPGVVGALNRSFES
jgi:GT2 family glycosyltransferase